MANAFVFEHLIARCLPDADLTTLRILDLGCGQGAMVRELLARGHDAYGCEIAPEPAEMQDEAAWTRPTDFEWADIEDRCRRIQMSPYRLPFEDGVFDVVISNHVFEHVQDKRAVALEVRRISKPGALGVHIFPSKYWLPTEPHLFVPFASWMWPNVPKWWLSLWAAAGVRNPHQTGLSAEETIAINVDYLKTGVNYAPISTYRRLFNEAFGEFHDLSSAYLAVAPGGTGKLVRKLPFRSAIAPAVSMLRERCVAHRLTASRAA